MKLLRNKYKNLKNYTIRRSYINIFLCIIMISITACTKSHDELKTVDFDIYILVNQKEGDIYKPYYMKNDEMYVLPYTGATQAIARKIFVSGDDVYVAGFITKDITSPIWAPQKAILWKNGVLQELTVPGAKSTGATGIAVSGKDVYVGGSYISNNDLKTAVYWKNGEPSLVSDNLKNSYDEFMFVSGSDVYITGYGISNVPNELFYWKNNTLHMINDPYYTGDAISMFVDENDVYLVGINFGGAAMKGTVWKNGEAFQLESYAENTHSMAYSIYVENGNVYAAGLDQTEDYVTKPALWKNGKKMNLEFTNTGAVHKVRVVEGHVFAIGFADFYTLWHNGKANRLSLARSITSMDDFFVVKR